jgi:hypothetical protein
MNARLAAAATLAMLAAAPLLAGPPWISVEIPANPMDAETRGAFAVVRTYHHGTPATLVMRGTAEGLVDGRRRSAPLEYRALNPVGRFALLRTWDSAGVWVLNIEAFDGHGAMSAVVGINANGEAVFVRVPLSRIGGPRTVSQGEIQRLLADLAAGRTPEPLAAAGFGGMGSRIALAAGVIVSAAALALMVLGRLVALAWRRLRPAAV